MSYAGSLLFSRQGSLFVPGASVNCCLFQGNSTTRVLDQKIFDADLLSNYRSAVTYLLAHLDTAYHIGVDRVEQLEIPEGALREALVNAMAHRDYRKPGDLQVHIFQDRIEIVNPGGLVGGMTLEKLGNTSLPRNPLLFGMMHRMGLVEKIGSGITRMADMCRDRKTPAPEIQADPDWFRIVFRRPTDESLDVSSEKASGKRQESVGKEAEKRRESVGKTSGKVLDACRENSAITIPELAGRIGVTERSIQRSIRTLQKTGLLRRVGGRKEGRWEVLE